MVRRNPFKHHWFPQYDNILAVRWYFRIPLSYRDIRDLLAERGNSVDAVTVYRWACPLIPVAEQNLKNRATGRFPAGSQKDIRFILEYD